MKSIRYGSKQCFSPKDLNFYLFSIHPLLEPGTSLALTTPSFISQPSKTKVLSPQFPQSPSWFASRCHFFKKDKVNAPLRIWAKCLLQRAVWDPNSVCSLETAHAGSTPPAAVSGTVKEGLTEKSQVKSILMEITKLLRLYLWRTDTNITV